MGSPFRYEDPLDAAEELADRMDELELLRERIAETRNSRVAGPRRYGKTSLLNVVLASADRDGFVPIYVNFLGVLTAADVAERIERSYREQLDGALRRWFAGVVSTLSPRAKAASAGVGIEVAPTATVPGLLDRLELPRRLYERHGRRCAVVFDEFQDVVRAGGELAGTIRSELERHGNVAGYIFSGSHPGLMRDLFSDRRHAFFAQAMPVDLGPLGGPDLADYIGERFEAGRRDPGEALEPLLRVADGHPQRAMLLAHHLYQSTRPRTRSGPEQWLRAFAAATRDANPEVQAVWDSWSNSERRLGAVIAQRTIPLQGKGARERYGVTKSGNNEATVDRLQREGQLVADPRTATGLRVVDPLLELWLANGRGWPTELEAT
ncbi:MAG TPA: ATP-binding protein [Solirubrobacteraceae bacterium]|nr:ATP-binding protein [Solirubrobacteraceae bacterium]